MFGVEADGRREPARGPRGYEAPLEAWRAYYKFAIERNPESVMSFKLKLTIWTCIALLLFRSGTRVREAVQRFLQALNPGGKVVISTRRAAIRAAEAALADL